MRKRRKGSVGDRRDEKEKIRGAMQINVKEDKYACDMGVLVCG